MMTDMKQFQNMCRNKFVAWHHAAGRNDVDLSNTFVVWAVKALQNFKCLVSTSATSVDGYAEFTYNGDKRELYGDYYNKTENVLYKIVDEE